jgi:hypothetical protein
MRPAALELRGFLASPTGKEATPREREALRKVLPHLTTPTAETFRLLIFALRTPAPVAPTQWKRVGNGKARGKI